MCICLNCSYLNICKQYFFVEKNHKELNINKNAKFLPSQSIINIIMFQTQKTLEIEFDIIECLSFKEKPGKWIIYY